MPPTAPLVLYFAGPGEIFSEIFVWYRLSHLHLEAITGLDPFGNDGLILYDPGPGNELFSIVPNLDLFVVTFEVIVELISPFFELS